MLTKTLISFLIGLAACSFAFSNEKDPVWGDAKTDQEKCQAEADYMAKHKALRHVGPVIGLFEGVGWSKCGTPPTCTPRRKMKLTGDATAKCKDGTIIRVRSWR